MSASNVGLLSPEAQANNELALELYAPQVIEERKAAPAARKAYEERLTKYNADVEQMLDKHAARLGGNKAAEAPPHETNLEPPLAPQYRAIIRNLTQQWASASVDNRGPLSECLRQMTDDKYLDDLSGVTWPGEKPKNDEEITAYGAALLSQFWHTHHDSIQRYSQSQSLLSSVCTTGSGIQFIEVASGRLTSKMLVRTALRVAEEQRGKGATADTHRLQTKVNTFIEVRKLRMIGEVPKVAEMSNTAVREMAIQAAIANGTAISGRIAPGLASIHKEINTLAKVPVRGISTPRTAATPMIATILGHIIHMRTIANSSTEAKTFQQWMKAEVPVSVRGFGDVDTISGMHINDVLHFNGHANILDNMPINVDDSGNLTTNATYWDLAERPKVSCPGEQEGWYLLTIPTRGSNTVALTAAALALTALNVPMEATRGHMQLMTIARECNVSFIACGGASADAIEDDARGNPWHAATPYCVDDMIQILGYLFYRHLDNSMSTLMNSTSPVAGLFQPAAASHHDPTDVIYAGLHRLSHSFSEPAVDGVYSNGRTVKKVRIDDRTLGYGGHVVKDLVQLIEAQAYGRAAGMCAVMQRANLVLNNGDVETYQRDLGYHITNLGNATCTVSNFKKRADLTGTSPDVHPELASIAMTSLGIDAVKSHLASDPWAPAAVVYAPGCAYVNSNGTSLKQVIVRDEEFDERVVRPIVEDNAGMVSTVDPTGVVLDGIRHAAQVADIGLMDPHWIYKLALTLWNDVPDFCVTALKHLNDANTRPAPGPLPLEVPKQAYLDAMDWLRYTPDHEAEYMDDLCGSRKIDVGTGTTTQLRAVCAADYQDAVSGQSTKAAHGSKYRGRQWHRLITQLLRALKALIRLKLAGEELIGAQGLRQAVALGWWHGGDTLAMAKWYAMQKATKEGLIIGAGFTAKATGAEDPQMAAASACFVAQLLSTQSMVLTVTARTRQWATVGATIVGDNAIPALTLAWMPRDIRAYAEIDDDVASIMAMFEMNLRGTTINAKFSSTPKLSPERNTLGSDNVTQISSLEMATAVFSSLERVGGLIDVTPFMPGQHRTGDYGSYTAPTPSDAVKRASTKVMYAALFGGNKPNEGGDKANTGGGNGNKTVGGKGGGPAPTIKSTDSR